MRSTLAFTLLAAASLSACAHVPANPYERRAAAPYHATPPASRIEDDDLNGITTLAPTADTGPYNADPLQKFGKGAPPR